MQWVYNVIVHLSILVLRIVSIFNSKIKSFLEVRKNWERALIDWSETTSVDKPVMCFHCASLGEYEMIRPILEDERIQAKYQCVLSFFSASGYNYAKLEGGLSGKFYVPLDTKVNMQRFVELMKPEVFVFVKYDLWYNLIRQLQKAGSRVFLVNALFRDGQFMTGVLGKPILKAVSNFEKVFVQNEGTQELLTRRNFRNVVLSNDLRFDRVMQARNQGGSVERIEGFCKNQLTLIAGSSWPEEEAILRKFLRQTTHDLRLVIAPHDISDAHIDTIEESFKSFGVERYSDEPSVASKVLIINAIGQLAKSYQYADIAFVGGAFGKGLHNVLEAVSYGLPIITGPNTEKFPEAQLLAENKTLFIVSNSDEFVEVAHDLLSDQSKRKEIRELSEQWLSQNTGATAEVIEHLL